MSLSRANIGLGSFVAALGVSALTIVTTGCPAATPLEALDVVVTAAQVAIPALASAGAISSEDSDKILAYLSAVNTAAGQAATELASSDSSALKATKIAGFFAAAAKPVLSGAASQKVITIVQGIDAAVSALLVNIGQPPPPSPGHAGPVAVAGIPGGKSMPDVTKQNTSDPTVKRELDNLQKRNEANTQAMDMLKKSLGK
jgi:hypothetical protein